MQTITLDSTLPNSDPFRSPTNAGRVRYIDSTDALTLATLNRVFGDVVHRTSLISSKLSEVVGALNEKQGTGDVSRNVLSNGTVPFTKPQRGVAPTAANHLTTRSYVDTSVSGISSQIATVAANLEAYKGVVPLSFTSGWVNYNWQAGARTIVNLALASNGGKVLDPDTVLSITILERLDIATPTNAVPNPTPSYVYRQLSKGANGFAIEDFWLIPSTRTVRILVPNSINYDSSYLNSGYDKLQTPRSRALQVVVNGSGITI